MITWNSHSFLDEISHRIDSSALAIGKEVVTIARRNASGFPGPTPRTGHLRASIDFDYNAATHAINFRVDVPYAVFVEYGTRHSHAYPFLRPALNAVKTIFGFETSMEFGAFETDRELLAGGSRYIGGKGLTAGQKRHVKYNLKPKMLRHHIGNVARAEMKVRTFSRKKKF